MLRAFRVEGILRGDVLAAEEGANVATKVLLVLDDLVQRDLVLHKQRNLDVELIDVLLCELVLAHVLDNSLPKTLEL